MNKKLTVLAILCIAAVVGGLWYWSSSVRETSSIEVGTVSENDLADDDSQNSTKEIVREPSSADRQVYVNQKWRFSFEYPKENWKIREPAFGSATTLFNLAVWPEDEGVFDPVSVNFTPKWWIDRLLDRKEGDVMIGGRSGWYYQSVTMSVIPKMSYFVLINDEYWVNIGIQNEYLEEFSMILDTFQFHEPLPTLEDLDIDPANPPGA